MPGGDPGAVTAGSFTPVPATLVPAGGIDGVARDAAGEPLTDVTVSGFDSSGTMAGTARSDMNGFAITSLPAGAYRLCCSGARSVDA